MANETTGDLTQTPSFINKQVEDILRITGQNEVIQSFVRTDGNYDLDDKSNLNETNLTKEKKNVGFGGKPFEIPDTFLGTEKSEDTIVETDIKPTGQTYHLLGKDAEFNNYTSATKTKNKWNKRQRLLEEVYTDKDRAAAVNLGSRDIKQSLKLKRRQDRCRILEISEETHLGNLLALGIRRFKAGDIYVAIKFFNKALELSPYDKNVLVARSKCHLLMGNPKLALEDAEQALIEEKNFIKGLYQKAEALYHLARFEYSLMYFYRGLHIRPQMENFKRGVHKARQAINNTIGKTRVSCFEKFFPRTCNNLMSQEINLNHSSFQKHNTNSKMYKSKMLRKLQIDEIYLEKLLKNPNINHINGDTEANNKILEEAEDGMKFLKSRKNFWKQQAYITTKKV